jgi:hypothetical protein
MEVGNPIWNTFHVANFFQISTDFELTQRFLENSLERIVVRYANWNPYSKCTRAPF